jgi:diamine N-acetyltransferase
VYAEDTPVGFVMIADEVDNPDYIPQYLWKLLIDERYQRQGFGTATLDLIIEYFRGSSADDPEAATELGRSVAGCVYGHRE